MKVIGINGSSRKDGNTAIIIGKVFDERNKKITSPYGSAPTPKFNLCI